MIEHPLTQQLQQLKCHGMAQAIQEQFDNDEYRTLSFDERLALLIEREKLARENRQYTSRLRRATLKHAAAIVDIQYNQHRGLSQTVITKLSAGDYLRKRQNLLITGATGTGKTFLACAFGEQACRQSFRVKYWRVSRLLQAFIIARADGTYSKLLKQLSQVNLLILDDWGLEPLNDVNKRDLLELLDDRHQEASTCLTSQLPVKQWHSYIADPTLADAILDRLVHNAHKIELLGDSMRKTSKEVDTVM